MKILHIATDEKFIDHAYPVFEKVYPASNEVFVFTYNKELKYVKLIPDYIENKPSHFFRGFAKLPKSKYVKYDLIVFHSFDELIYREIKNVPDGIPVIWLGWGFDYYSDLLSDIPLILGETLRLRGNLGKVANKYKVFSRLKKIVRKLFHDRSKMRAVEKVSVFSPVLPQEYLMVKNSRKWKNFPEFESWNYGTLEDNLIKGFEGERVFGNAILVGNSATYTANHVEVFSLLHKLKISGRKIFSPLSYGDEKLTAKIVATGEMYFSDCFVPLTEFVPVEEYVSTIRQCGYVIMNHVRQQAVGNIVIMLYLGARVFVRQENPVLKYFRDSGVVLSTVQELEANPQLINQPLTDYERSSNREIVSSL